MTTKEFPKIELHLHFEGAAPPAFIRQLAFEKKVDLSGIFDADGGYKYRNFDHFLEVYEAATSVLTSPEDFARLTRAMLSETAEHGVIYAESFVSPEFCGGGDLGAWREYLAAIEEAAREAERDFGITMKAILTAIRHFGPEKAKATALCAAETVGDFVVGFGMGGAEMMHRPGDFAYSYDMAREAGLKLTCHAGEWGGPDMVADTIRDLRVERIGHGINAIKDPRLVEDIAAAGITLEVCPGSNVFLGAVESWQAHPIKPLREAGVNVTVSTDDPPFFHTTMTKEFDMLRETFGWGPEVWAELNQNALKAAFCDDETKARLAQTLETQND